MPRSSEWSFPFGLRNQNFVRIIHFHCAPLPSHLPWFDNSDFWWRVQFIIFEFSHPRGISSVYATDHVLHPYNLYVCTQHTGRQKILTPKDSQLANHFPALISVRAVDLCLQLVNTKASDYAELRTTRFEKCFRGLPHAEQRLQSRGTERVTYFLTCYCEQMNNDATEIWRTRVLVYWRWWTSGFHGNREIHMAPCSDVASVRFPCPVLYARCNLRFPPPHL